MAPLGDQALLVNAQTWLLGKGEKMVIFFHGDFMGIFLFHFLSIHSDSHKMIHWGLTWSTSFKHEAGDFLREVVGELNRKFAQLWDRNRNFRISMDIINKKNRAAVPCCATFINQAIPRLLHLQMFSL